MPVWVMSLVAPGIAIDVVSRRDGLILVVMVVMVVVGMMMMTEQQATMR